MPDTDLLQRSAIELAALVRTGECSARELTELALRCIEDRNPRVGAFVDVQAERALEAADAIAPGDERPFAGVPTAIKDNRAIKDWRLTYAADLFGEFVAPFDHNIVRRLRDDAGFILVGKTNLPEYGILPWTEPRRFGPARNPWDLDRTPGGSSGGAAAAVAGGMLPVAHGNDGGGSTRIPAACCGLVGLKPQRGRISLAPELGDHPLVQDGMLTRTVADTAALLDVLAGPEPGDATWAPPPDEPYAVAALREPGPLRVGLALAPPLPDAKVDPMHIAAARDTAQLLASMGHEVTEIEPGWSDGSLLPLFSLEFGAAIAMSVAFSGLIAGREPCAQDMQGVSWALYEHARNVTGLQLSLGHTQLQGAMRTLLSELAPYDLVVTPGLATRPPRIGEFDNDAPEPMKTFADSGLFTPFTAICNASGQPAITLPLHHGDDGLPTGTQIMGRPAREDVLLQVATQLEAARPWAGRLAGAAELGA